ncbi:MAG: methyl-accepting chemotaxis protein [Cellulosilyticaceae bacterium]
MKKIKNIRIKKMQLSTKILIPTFIILCIVIFGGFIMIYNQTSSVIQDMALRQLEDVTKNIQLNIENELQPYMHTLGTFKLNIQREGKVDSHETEEMTQGLKGILQQYPELYGSWIIVNPEAMDDASQYKNKPLYDEDGRFAPYFENNGGNILEGTLTSHKKEGEANYFYTKPLETGKTYITDALTYEYKGEMVTVISLCVPFEMGGKVAGVVGLDIEIGALAQKVSEFKIYDTGYAVMFDKDYTIIAHPNSELIGFNPYEEDKLSTQEMQMMDQTSTERVFNLVEARAGGEGKVSYKTFVPTQISEEALPYIIQLVVPKSEVQRASVKLQTSLTAVGLGILILLAVTIQRVVAMQMRRLKREMIWLNQLGEGDLTIHEQKVAESSEDEIGMISTTIDNLSSKLNGIIGLVKQSADQVSQSGEELNQSASQTATATQSIAESITQVAEGSQEQLTYVEQMVSIGQDTHTRIENMVSQFDDIQDITKTTVEATQRGSMAIEQITERVGGVVQATNEAEAANKELLETSNKIHTIIALIENIAKQTNLLSLNAAIEAARAGEAGKGFAVVASEITKLANEVEVAIKDISLLIASNDSSIKKLEQKLHECLSEVTQSVEGAKDAKQKFQEIEQHIGNLSGEIIETHEVVQDIQRDNQEVSTLIGQVADVARTQAHEAQESAAATQEQYATMEEVSSLSVVLADLAKNLTESMKYFKI